MFPSFWFISQICFISIDYDFWIPVYHFCFCLLAYKVAYSLLMTQCPSIWRKHPPYVVSNFLTWRHYMVLKRQFRLLSLPYIYSDNMNILTVPLITKMSIYIFLYAYGPNTHTVVTNPKGLGACNKNRKLRERWKLLVFRTTISLTLKYQDKAYTTTQYISKVSTMHHYTTCRW